MLARMKRLRGTPFDPFGHTAERRMERDLIAWYERLVGTALSRLSPETHAQLAAILAMPLDIRGYGPVKEQAAQRVRGEIEKRLSAA